MKLREQCLLGLEACTNPVSVGLWQGGKPLGLTWLDHGLPGSQTLLLGVERLLVEVGLTKGELQGICVTQGPGSFTSVRLGLATAEGLGLGLGIPLYGVGLLQVLANQLRHHPGRIQVIQNAYKGEVYWGLFQGGQGQATALQPPQMLRPEVWAESLQPGDLVMGSGLALLRAQGLDLARWGATAETGFLAQAHALGVIEALLEAEAIAPGGPAPQPIYLRLSEAEVNYGAHFAPRSLG